MKSRALTFAAATALTFAPKCAVCVYGYLATAFGTGLVGRELCGTPVDPSWSSGGSFSLMLAASSLLGFAAWRLRQTLLTPRCHTPGYHGENSCSR
jgi:hypothetical protein